MGLLVENFGGAVAVLAFSVVNLVESGTEGGSPLPHAPLVGGFAGSGFERSLPGPLVGIELWCAALVANFGRGVVLELLVENFVGSWFAGSLSGPLVGVGLRTEV